MGKPDPSEKPEEKDAEPKDTPPEQAPPKAPEPETLPLTAAEQRKLLSLVSELKELGAKSHAEIIAHIEAKHGKETARAAEKAVKEIDRRGLRHLMGWWPW